ncbi:sulfite reductase (ferredoxin) [Candidatus Hakubella thermalkaliphila]|uniref:Sulfite reductase (Ferredoxin) n=1 Tax=Candidatus Hakubella thermalkaliphila TaxID=2754717 RepID=A0A6V8PPW5_9ACTN|nr:sulfurtransferase TusA family protein [Candidatus Hakubella thermalkaliphila]GFP34277.1 sulfite reductase (ferredoxin) [Candidatus Hakubella thermalkaliphila]
MNRSEESRGVQSRQRNGGTIHYMDLRGEICPMNWVRTKLKLEELDPGEPLEVLLDEGEPIQNVPRSARSEGHRILNLKREGSYYRVLIERGALSHEA